jgi:hypothetical protein
MEGGSVALELNTNKTHGKDKRKCKYLVKKGDENRDTK